MQLFWCVYFFVAVGMMLFLGLSMRSYIHPPWLGKHNFWVLVVTIGWLPFLIWVVIYLTYSRLRGWQR